MNRRTNLIALGMPAMLCLGACQSPNFSAPAVKIAPAQTLRHGAASQPDALYAIGRYHQGQVRYDKAIEAYQRLLAEHPDHAEARNALAIVLSTQGNHDAAIWEFEQATMYAPESASIRNNLGYAYMMAGRVAEAIETLRMAARLDPANARVRDNLEIALTKSGKTVVRAVKDAAPPATANESEVQSGSERIRLIAVADNVFELRPAVPKGTPPAAVAPLRQGVAADSPAQPAPAATGPRPRIEVSNGNGIAGLARQTSAQLQSAGYGKARLTNELPFRTLATEIQYRPGFEPQARQLRAALRDGIKLVASSDLRADIQLRLLLGKDVKSVPEVVAEAASESRRPVGLASAR